MLKQAQDRNNGKLGMALDHEHIRKGMEWSPEVPEDKPYSLTHMLRTQRERKSLPLEHPASKTPDFHELTDLVRRPTSEATSLEQLPHALVCRVDRFSLCLFASLLQPLHMVPMTSCSVQYSTCA